MREALLSELAAYASGHPEESPTIGRFADFVAGHPDAMARSCMEGHVTGSAFVVDPWLTRVLMVHHAKLDRWLQPGGHCEMGEDGLAAALREAREETGLGVMPLLEGRLLDIDIHAFPARGDVPAHLHYDLRYLLEAGHGTETPSEESHALEWLEFHEARRRNGDASISRPLAKVEALRGKLSAARKDT